MVYIHSNVQTADMTKYKTQRANKITIHLLITYQLLHPSPIYQNPNSKTPPIKPNPSFLIIHSTHLPTLLHAITTLNSKMLHLPHLNRRLHPLNPLILLNRCPAILPGQRISPRIRLYFILRLIHTFRRCVIRCCWGREWFRGRAGAHGGFLAGGGIVVIVGGGVVVGWERGSGVGWVG